MRLTLRTLLSWKDGMLDDEAARDLAAKVEASAAARRLVDRIDEVTGRPTLAAPAPDATGFAAAANSTAEYLDNVLADEQLGAFERVCFASDAQLAETAACHEMLADWSRAPAGPLDAAARRRLLAAVQARVAGEAPAGAGEAWSEATAGGHPPRTAHRPEPRVARSGRPAVVAWLLVAASLALLATLVGVLGWSLTKRQPKPRAGEAVAAAPRVAEDRGGAGAAPVDAVAASREVATPDAATSVPVADAPVSDTRVADAPVSAEPAQPPPPAPAAVVRDDDFPPVADADAAGREPMNTGAVVAPVAATPRSASLPPAEPPADQRVPQGDALAIAAPAAAVPDTAGRTAEAPAPASGQAAPPSGAATIAGPAVLLYRPAGNATAPWLAGAADAPLAPPVDLLAPPFGRPTIVIDETRIRLEPGTRATLVRDADGTPRLEVVFGAAIAVGGRVGVTAGGLTGIVTTAAAAPVGVEARLLRRPGDGAEATQRVARIMPSGGPIGWQTTGADGDATAQPLAGIGATVDIPAGRALEWHGGTPDAATVASIGGSPPWLTGRGSDDPIDHLAADALARRLSPGSAAVPVLGELAADRRAEQRVAAAATLALAGEFDALARLLVADGASRLPDGLWTRLEAVAVDPALARGPRAAEALARAIDTHAPPGAADTVARFARGFSDEELAAGAASELVAALESPHLVVRRYAIKNLVAITNADAVDRLRYRADRPPDALREGAAWWRTQLEQGRIRRAADR